MKRLIISVLFCLALAPAHALEIGQEFPVTQNSACLVGIIAGYDGDNYLVVYNYAGGVYCQFVAPDGSLRGDPLKAGDSEDFIAPGAYGAGEYLIVWKDADNHLLGRLLSKSGGFKGAAFPINQTAHDKSQLACAFGADAFLVTWEDKRGSDDDIYGQVVASSGDLVGSETPVSALADDQRMPSLSYDGTHFLVIWYDYRNGINDKHVFGQCVDASGNLSGASFQISQTPTWDGMPLAMAFDGQNYLVVWNKKVDSEGTVIWDLMGRIVSPTGTFPKGGEFVVTDASGVQNFPSATFNGLNHLVTWMDERSGVGIELMGRIVSREGKLNGDEITITGLEPVPASDNQPYFADQIWNGEQYLTVYGRGDIQGLFNSGFTTMAGDLVGKIVRPLGNDGDASAVLKTLCKINDEQKGSHVQADINQDGRLGQEEALFALQSAAGAREPFDGLTLVLNSDATYYASNTPFVVENMPAGKPEKIRVLNEHGVPPTMDYCLAMLSSAGTVWLLEGIPAGTSEITLGVAPAGATEVAPFTGVDDIGTYFAGVNVGTSEIGDDTMDFAVWRVLDGAPLAGDAITVNLANPSGIQVDGMAMALIISNDDFAVDVFEYSTGAANFEIRAPEGDYTLIFILANDGAGLGFMPLTQTIPDALWAMTALSGANIAAAGGQVNLELGKVADIQGAVRFQDQSQQLLPPPLGAVAQVVIESPALTVEMAAAYHINNDGSFSGPMYYLKEQGAGSVDVTVYSGVEVGRNLSKWGSHGGFSYGRFLLEDAPSLGAVENPVITYTARPVSMTVQGIQGNDQWVCQETGEVLTAANNKISGIVYTASDDPYSMQLFFDRDKDGIVDRQEHAVNPYSHMTIFNIPENLMILTLDYEGFRWNRRDVDVNNGWYVAWGISSAFSGTQNKGYATIGLDNPQANPALPTQIVFYQDSNGNGNVDSGEPAVTLTNIPPLTDRYCLDYPDVIQASDFSPWP